MERVDRLSSMHRSARPVRCRLYSTDTGDDELTPGRRSDRGSLCALVEARSGLLDCNQRYPIKSPRLSKEWGCSMHKRALRLNLGPLRPAMSNDNMLLVAHVKGSSHDLDRAVAVESGARHVTQN